MKNWKVGLTSGGETLGEVKIYRNIFQTDSFLPILLVITLIPLSILLRDMKAGYVLGGFRGKSNHLLFMDLKLYGKAMQELDSLVQTVRIFSSDLGMKFGISKCAILEMKQDKVVHSEGMELPNGETIKLVEDDEKGYKNLGVLQFDSVKSKEMKDMVTKEFCQRIRKILKATQGTPYMLLMQEWCQLLVRDLE